jgi:acyl-CoA synthetase (AMP-forming)/AMP-acid ligase II
MIGEEVAGIDAWDAFLARGQAEPRELAEATGEAVRPGDPAVIFFFSGSTSRPKGILNAHRGVAIQPWVLRHRVPLPPGKQEKKVHNPAIGAPAGSASGYERARKPDHRLDSQPARPAPAFTFRTLPFPAG